MNVRNKNSSNLAKECPEMDEKAGVTTSLIMTLSLALKNEYF